MGALTVVTDAPTDGTPTGPSRLMRRVTGPLLAYHALILLGAFVLVWGAAYGSRSEVVIGSVLIGAGIALELAIVAWTASLTRDAARSRGTSGTLAGAPAVPGSFDRWLCTGCGRRAEQKLGICPRCGRSMIWLGGPAGRD